MAKVKLGEVVDNLEIVSDFLTVYYEPETGKFYEILEDEDDDDFDDDDFDEDDFDDDDFDDDDFDEDDQEDENLPPEPPPLVDEDEYTRLVKSIDAHPEKYIPLPDSFEIDVYSMMKDFCYTIDDVKLQETFIDALDGNGAFSRFRRLCDRYDLIDSWYAFKQDEMRKIAVRWCEVYKLEYE